MAGTAPFHQQSYALEAGAREHALSLALVSTADAEMLGSELVGMDPWVRLGMLRENMTRLLAVSDANKRCFTIWYGEERAGVIAIRHPWLSGPYLNLLAVLPPFQQRGIARAALDWLDAEATAAGSRNCFLSVSAFNTVAYNFYVSCGYRQAAMLQDLIKDGEDEILMRKRLR